MHREEGATKRPGAPPVRRRPTEPKAVAHRDRMARLNAPKLVCLRRRGVAGHVRARLGRARLGAAWQGAAWQGRAWQAQGKGRRLPA
jgi:hypothetical protein